jgi:hypothetical protein
METELSMVEAITKSELLASWDRKRSDEELNDFLSRREAKVVDFEDQF